MAEVIGKDTAVSKEVSCRGCGARVRYYANDVKERRSTDYTGDTSTYYRVKCPDCAFSIPVPYF